MIVVSYGVFDDSELESHEPRVVHVDDRQRDRASRCGPRVPGGGGPMSTEPRVPNAPPAAHRSVTIPQLAEMKERGEPIVMVTAYDFPSAQVAEEAQVDVVLVGDTAAMTVLGYDSTVPVSMDEMIMLASAVRRGCAQSAGDRGPAVRQLSGVQRAGGRLGRALHEGSGLRRGQDGDGGGLRRSRGQARERRPRPRDRRGRHPGDGPRRPHAPERVGARRVPHAGTHDAAGRPGGRRRARPPGRGLLRRSCSRRFQPRSPRRSWSACASR